MRYFTLAMTLLVCAACMAEGPYVELKGKRFTVEVAESQEKQALGLMFRESMPDDHGMVFIFPAEGMRSFWMKNTRIPLDIMYFDKELRMVSVSADTPPCKVRRCPSYPSKGPAMYVLELNAGMAAKLGVGEGDVLNQPAQHGTTQPGDAEQEQPQQGAELAHFLGRCEVRQLRQDECLDGLEEEQRHPRHQEAVEVAAGFVGLVLLAEQLDAGDLDRGKPPDPGSGRDQLPDDDVLLEATHEVALRLQRRLSEYPSRFLERRGGQPRVGCERGLRDTEKQRLVERRLLAVGDGPLCEEKSSLFSSASLDSVSSGSADSRIDRSLREAGIENGL